LRNDFQSRFDQVDHDPIAGGPGDAHGLISLGEDSRDSPGFRQRDSQVEMRHASVARP
jgi:hypothetical protein